MCSSDLMPADLCPVHPNRRNLVHRAKMQQQPVLQETVRQLDDPPVPEEDNVRPGTPYYEITELAAKCTAKRLVPDYISAKVMKELKQGEVYTCMGCRSFLTVEDSQRNEDGSHKFYGRFNQGVVTINLVDVACSSDGNMEIGRAHV